MRADAGTDQLHGPTIGGVTATARRPALLLCDAAVIVWIVTWIIVGLLVGHDVHSLRTYGDTMDQASVALDQTGKALAAVGKIPVVGDRVDELADEVRATSADMASNAQQTRGTVDSLSVLLPLCVMVIPTVPVVAAYLPGRLRRRRDRRLVLETLSREGAAPVAGYLAIRAVARLPIDELSRFTDDPWGDLAAGRLRALASAELDRMGIDLPAGS
jgi:hypothetical protein